MARGVVQRRVCVWYVLFMCCVRVCSGVVMERVTSSLRVTLGPWSPIGSSPVYADVSGAVGLSHGLEHSALRRLELVIPTFLWQMWSS